MQHLDVVDRFDQRDVKCCIRLIIHFAKDHGVSRFSVGCNGAKTSPTFSIGDLANGDDIALMDGGAVFLPNMDQWMEEMLRPRKESVNGAMD